MKSRPRGLRNPLGAALALVVTVFATAVCHGQALGPAPLEHVDYQGDPAAPRFSGPWRLVVDAAVKSPKASKEGWKPWPPPLRPAFVATWRKRVDAADDPVIGCMPAGMPRFVTADTTPMLIVQTGGRVLFYRDGEGPRRVWLDGRPFPEPADLETFLKGTALGHYEGGDLIIETRGIRDQPIDDTGVPHSDQLKIMERYHKVDGQTMNVVITLIDTIAYTRPMTTSVTYKRITDPNWAPVEFICAPKTDYHPDKYIH